MWVIVDYEPVAAFGLRPSNTTSSGGKSLVCPTPYAIKMALLDRMIRHWGLDYGLERFPLVRDLQIHIRVPDWAVVNRTFQKVLRPDGKLWTQTIAQREYCFHAGTMTLAFEMQDADFADELLPVLASINYFGRKGSFMQYMGLNSKFHMPASDYGFVDLCRPPENNVVSFGFLQRMDDMRSDATFEDVSVLSKPSPDGGRITYNVILPYHLKHHGFNHTVYERGAS